jgi:hypothetical protein
MAPKGGTELKVGADSVAVITIINPPVYSLSIDGMGSASTPSSPESVFLILLCFVFLGGRLMRDWGGLSNWVRGVAKVPPLC